MTARLRVSHREVVDLALITELPGRIHFSVHYPELDFAARKSIWKTFFSRASLPIAEEEVNKLAEHRLNGRQVYSQLSKRMTLLTLRSRSRTRSAALRLFLCRMGHLS